MPPRPAIPQALRSKLLARSLQTSQPLPPAQPPLEHPIASTSTLSPAQTSSASTALESAGLQPLLPPSTPSLPDSTAEAIHLISSQSTPSSGRYILARLHARTYLLHPKDILTVPTLKPLQPPGTILALTRILEVGSRDYAIRSPAADGKSLRKLGVEDSESVPDWVARCGLTVLEHTKSPLERLLKKKRRKGYEKTIQHKQGWTRLRVGDIEVGPGTGATPEAAGAPS